MYSIKSGHKTAKIPTLKELCEFWNQHHPFEIIDIDKEDELDYLELMGSIERKKASEKFKDDLNQTAEKLGIDPEKLKQKFFRT